MDTTPHRTGTSLEVLAPYLPYGIEVETTYEEGQDSKREKLIGLAYNAVELVNVEWAPLRNYWYGAKHCLPVLRPFSALCTPLEDGSVPAVEVAKMLFEEPDYTFKAVHESAEETAAYARVVVAGSWKGADDTFMLVIYEGWGVDALYVDCDGAEEDSGISTNGVWDKLRAMHFACGLDPSQYIAK